MNTSEHIRRAIEIAGSQEKLAVKIGFSQMAVSKALRAERVSAEMAVAVESATSGQVTREQLRPDLFAVALTQPSQPEQAA